MTGADGTALFTELGASKQVQRLLLHPARGFWPKLAQGVTMKNNSRFTLEPIDLAQPDALRLRYPATSLDAGAGVKVAVVDSGVSAHPHLKLASAVSVVTGEPASDAGDVSAEGHGTHVAGIIAARGSSPDGVRGLAPGVTLLSYRVVPRDGDTASNFAIAKAIDEAVRDKADLINLSIEDAAPDPLLRQALERARAAGVVLVAASGNGGRQPVSFPGSDPLVLAVSALGRRGSFPDSAAQTSTIGEPFGVDPGDYIASFSNIGDEVDFAAPGVGIVSTVPGGHAVLDGTSMACPAVTGAAAALLARQGDIRAMPRDAKRAEALTRVLAAAARTLGFGARFEGHGVLAL